MLQPDRTSSSSLGRRRLLGVLLALVSTPGALAAHRQPRFDAKALADYRLTDAVFKRFVHATSLLVAATARDRRFADEPLITREISVSGDAAEMAAALQTRLDAEPALSTALFAADISAHDYAAFAIALFAARMAQGFLKSGAMRRVPAGAAADNVAFVTAREAEVGKLLKQLQLE